ncbi:hypothetical protein CGRA01v4_07943 [Colletotrichum graminicola]|uniref:Tat pathway signal sequence n=1 Tax=Colletotrichum graminicola (strain M1.001 / M2 / FGSC 10212) TaxID=645133 RepID=E3Q7T5_COLGM|nr:uncharacterized protein GLRG_02118 [Colletotrichum graminicola M1.001]EFQ26947.1 hypothetical protein GLRG_02118 [Colletotrichum graminicola M1.001]WDK16660.1 hypothetical protein CGRA01v4_07943 [Colletotrichum graminicola]
MDYANVLGAVKTEPDENSGPLPRLVFSHLSKMRRVKDPEIWEQFTLRLLPILDDLESVCEKIASSRKLQPALLVTANNWMQQIHGIRAEAERRRETRVGVVGNTGDGKSSTINAILNEENLLPTNCMRACTAVATEVSYNHDDDVKNPYRAEIVFVSRNEWVREVSILLRDLTTVDDMTADGMDPSSEAAKALAKIQAVYPSLNCEMLASTTSSQLADHPNVQQVLGTTKTIKAPTASEMREHVEPFIDSMDKDDDTPAHWPLVKVVRIFTKAQVLSNGLTIVDLPGHQDWDAARAAVASQYLKACSGIWIVAPINRAVDNKTAKDLMGDSIKRQIKLDGSYSALTIICSKTDDININSAVESLRGKLDKDTMQTWDDAKKCEKQIKALEKELATRRNRRGALQGPDSHGGETPQAKRARTVPPTRPIAADGVTEVANENDQNITGVSETDEKEQELYELKLKKKDLVDEVVPQCIQKRNELSREAIRRHLAKSFKDLDRNDAALEPDDATPRDYEDMSRQTPVFCTSSKLYQEMHGIVLSYGDATPGYETEEDTEIPQLQAHAQKMTEELRITKHKEVLSGICQLLNSIVIWAQDSASSAITIDQATLTTLLQTFEAELQGDIENCMDQLHSKTQTDLYAEMTRLSSIATVRADIIAKKWQSINYNSFRATCRRRGVFDDRDLNEELLQPIKGRISVTWNNFFQFSIPHVLDNFAIKAVQRLASFHDNIVKQLGSHEYEELQAAAQLDQQLKIHKDRIMRLTAQGRVNIDQAQKDANRLLNPAVEDAMAPGYLKCASESGPGITKRMATAIQNHVCKSKVAMFGKAVGDVKHRLKEGTKLVDEHMTAQIEAIVMTMKGDYMLALAERQKSVQRLESSFRKSMMKVLKAAQVQFA